MRIGIEARFIEFGASGGIAPLLRGVLSALFRRNPDHEFFVYGTIFNRGLIERRDANVKVEALPLDGSTWRTLDGALARDKVDILLRSYPVLDSLRFPLSRQVVLVPDLQHDRFPEFFDAEVLRQRREAFAKVLTGTAAIGTISEFARKTILESPCNRCRDVFLMPPALKPPARSVAPEAFLKRVDEIGPFFLYPANLWPHKNHRGLLRAFSMFTEKTARRVAMVLTGHPEGWEEIRKEFSHLPLHHLGFVGEGELQALYRRAFALTFFSLYEGFGMPLLEAFDADCPVICSNTTSLPEVGGDAVLSCDPLDWAAMAAAMERVIEDGVLRQTLTRAGRARLKAFTWERSAGELMSALLRAGSRRDGATAAPLVSIVTPSYNQAPFLQRTIESVLRQTYKNIEYVVVDGASADGTVDILKAYGDRIRWISEPDEGQTAAINKGFALTRGQIRAYLNSDDMLVPDAVEKIVAFFDANPHCDMVYGDAQYIDSSDRVIGKYPTDRYSFDRLMWDCCVCQPAAFWRHEIASLVGTFDESLNLAMDYDYWLRIDRAGGRIVHFPLVLAQSRIHEEAKTQSRRSGIFKEIFEVCSRHGGYVSYNYFLGLWHHRLVPHRYTSPISSGALKTIPTLIARIHHQYFHLTHRLSGLFNRTGATVRRRGNVSASSPKGRTVEGIWRDSWLAPRVVFKSRKPGNADVILSGSAARDCRLKIWRNGMVAKEISLKKSADVDIEITCGELDSIRLEFSSSTMDAAGRKLSFRVSGTNLFEERDL